MLYINFLKPDEIKNPAVKLMRTAGFAIGGGIVAGVLLYILLVFMQVQAAKSSFENAKSAEASLQNSYHGALKLRDTNKKLVQMKNELVSFTNAHINVAEKLFALAESVPDTVQLINLEIDQELKNIQPKNQKLPPVAARRYFGKIQGRVSPSIGEKDYSKFLDNLNKLPESSSFGAVSPGGFDPEKNNSKKGGMPDFILTVNFEFEPKPYFVNDAEAMKK